MLGGMPGVPRIGFNVVDVRDLADLHLRAMTDAAAVGERFIGVGGFMWMSDVAAELRARLGADARRVPTRTLPDSASGCSRGCGPSWAGSSRCWAGATATATPRPAPGSAGSPGHRPPRWSTAPAA